MGGVCGPVSAWISSTSCDRRNIGQAKVDHDAVQILLLHHRQRFAAGTDGKNLDVGSAEQRPARRRGGPHPADTTSSFLVRRCRECWMVSKAAARVSLVTDFSR